MPAPHALPAPPALISRACDEIDRKVGRLPFRCGGSSIDRDLVATALEELNAEASRTLALRQREAGDGRVQVDGLDRHLALRGFADEGAAAAVADVLIRAGIAQKSSITDRRSRKIIQGIRLLPLWTWTIVTAGRNQRSGTVMTGDGDRAALPWTDLCPVCRAGNLNPVTGQRLYGIPETDFIACTSCGARFVPDSGRFRLAAIAKKQDPLWADLLNRLHTPEEWQVIAQNGGDERIGRQKAGKSRTTTEKDRRRSNPDDGGRIAVVSGRRTLYFATLPLVYTKRGIVDRYIRRREPLSGILQLPAFRHLAGIAGTNYRDYLNLPVGPFLHELKQRRDPFWHRFFHPYGESAFCSFRADGTGLSEKKGVYVVAANGALLAAGTAPHSFAQTVNETLGQVTPQACYLDGDPERCRVNSLLCSRNSRAGLFVHPLDDGDEITRIAAELAARLSPAGSGSADDPARFA